MDVTARISPLSPPRALALGEGLLEAASTFWMADADPGGLTAIAFAVVGVLAKADALKGAAIKGLPAVVAGEAAAKAVAVAAMMAAPSLPALFWTFVGAAW